MMASRVLAMSIMQVGLIVYSMAFAQLICFCFPLPHRGLAAAVAVCAVQSQLVELGHAVEVRGAADAGHVSQCAAEHWRRLLQELAEPVVGLVQRHGGTRHGQEARLAR